MEKSSGLILSPDGTPASIPTVLLDKDDALLLRNYKKFLAKYGLREAVYCNSCWNKDLSDGTDFHVTPHEIIIKCRCSLRYYKGSSY